MSIIYYFIVIDFYDLKEGGHWNLFIFIYDKSLSNNYYSNKYFILFYYLQNYSSIKKVQKLIILLMIF